MAIDSRVVKYREAAERMQRGNFDVEIPADGLDEVAQLGEALQLLAENLETRFDEAAKLTRIAERINAGLVVDEVLEEVYDSFKSVIPYDRIGLALLDQDAGVLRSRWARSEAVEIKLGVGYSAKMAGSSLNEILRTGRPRILNDLEAYLEEHPRSESTRLIVEEGIRSSLTCPLVALGKPIGFLFFSSCEKNTYREIHQDHFVRLASQISLILQKSRLYEKVMELNQKLLKMQKALEHEATHDALSDLWNRRAVLRLLEREMARAGREQKPLAVVIADIDHFKNINDDHGHLVGDEVLRQLCSRLVDSVRSAELIGRLGGEEFLIILYPCNEETLSRVLERVRLACAEAPFSTSVGNLPVTISLGAAAAENLEGVAMSAFLTSADEALYRAKRGGRNRWELTVIAPDSADSH